MKSAIKFIIVWVARIVFSVFVLPFLYAAKPFVHVKVGLVPNQRIGHLATNTDTFLRTIRNQEISHREFYVLPIWDPANRQMMKMFQRELLIIERKNLVRLYYALEPILEATGFFVKIKGTTVTCMRAANTTDPIIALTPQEEESGRRALEKMGIGRDDWFICFHTRDSKYLDVWRSQYQNIWGGSDYRNADIRECLKAAKYISSLGGYALRMGAVVETPLDTGSDPRIIDYANGHRTDFMDIFLSAKCRFFLGNNTGIAYVPIVFGTPVAMANATPFFLVPFGHNNLFNPKLLYKEKEERFLTFGEANELGFFVSDLSHEFNGMCKEHGLRQIDNTEDEILDLCRDMLDQCDGRTPSEEAAWLQQQYYDRYLSDLPYYEKVGARIGAQFALKYKDLIVPPI